MSVLARCPLCPDFVPMTYDELEHHTNLHALTDARADFGGRVEEDGEASEALSPNTTDGVPAVVGAAGTPVPPPCDSCPEPAAVRYREALYCSAHALSKLTKGTKSLPALRYELDHEWWAA